MVLAGTYASRTEYSVLQALSVGSGAIPYHDQDGLLAMITQNT